MRTPRCDRARIGLVGLYALLRVGVRQFEDLSEFHGR
jgi:hypothetical protein